MDNVLSGAHSVQDAIDKQQSTIDLLSSGGFPLRKFVASHDSIIDWLPRDRLAADPVSFTTSAVAVPVLGLSWQPKNDIFRFHVDPAETTSNLTQRTVLSQIARLFAYGMVSAGSRNCKGHDAVSMASQGRLERTAS